MRTVGPVRSLFTLGANDHICWPYDDLSSLSANVIEFLSDGNADFAKAIGLSMDGTGFGLGTRSQRYSMVVEDGVVRALNVEDAPSKAQHSGADNIMKDL